MLTVKHNVCCALCFAVNYVLTYILCRFCVWRLVMRRITEEEIIQSNVRVYIHIAHALARGYTDLFYVNMDTDEYIEFHTESKVNVRSLSVLREIYG